MYKLIRSILFLADPEKVHYFSMNLLKTACSVPFLRNIISSMYSPAEGILPTTFAGLQFKNLVGLGAGFDKNALYLRELEALGFGFIEIGTVTPMPQQGNEKPRLFRLPADKALINRMGFNNDGMEVIAERLKKWRMVNRTINEKRETKNDQRKTKLIIGGNIGKNKQTPNEDAWKDYEKCFLNLHPYVDYFVVNVSSPNTPGLRELQEKDALRKILTNLQQHNTGLAQPRPILLKIAPDLTNEQLDDVIDLAREINLDGLVAANTTLDRSSLGKEGKMSSEKFGAGGLSGMPAEKRSTEIVQYIHNKTNGQLQVIASGGIFTAADAKLKLEAGASLVQVWTGFVYEGPAIAKNICNALKK